MNYLYFDTIQPKDLYGDAYLGFDLGKLVVGDTNNTTLQSDLKSNAIGAATSSMGSGGVGPAIGNVATGAMGIVPGGSLISSIPKVLDSIFGNEKKNYPQNSTGARQFLADKLSQVDKMPVGGKDFKQKTKDNLSKAILPKIAELEAAEARVMQATTPITAKEVVAQLAPTLSNNMAARAAVAVVNANSPGEAAKVASEIATQEAKAKKHKWFLIGGAVFLLVLILAGFFYFRK